MEVNMKLIANNYEPKTTFKLIREWTGLTQKELAQKLNRKSRHGIKNIENGLTRFYFETIFTICQTFNIYIIFEKKNKMKLISNDYELKDIFKILREWTELTQEELSKELNYKSRYGIKKYETGENRYYYDTILEICKKHNITIIFEKH